jgi:photosystem II stability/assembly factor-like uncharacterized protein
MLPIVAFGLVSPPAVADGAFPDEFSIHFPPNAPDRIIVGANFGVMVSEDRGATWRYACEPYVTTGSASSLSQINVIYYQVTSDGAVLADSTNGAVTRSADVGCSWPMSGGSIAGLLVTDVFPSPTDPAFVLAITATPTGSSLWASHDGGKTFDSPALYTSNVLLTGIEIARSAPAVVYATLSGPAVAKLLRSADAGQTWATYDLPMLPPPPGQQGAITPQPRILAVDPDDANIVYLRLLGPPYDAIAVVTNGGQTVEVALTISGVFSAFARTSDKALYAGTSYGDLYVRPPQGAFAAPTKGPRLRCLGQRPGTTDLYACGDMFQDGFSVGVSHDGGRTFQKVMKISELLGPLTCAAVQNACADHWARIQVVFGADAGTPPAADGGGGAPPSRSGHCASAGAGALGSLALIAFALRRRGRR